MYTDRSEAEWIAAGYRHTASRTSVRAPRSVHTHAHSAASGRVCVARAPHGNDESSTLEHLVCSFLSAFHRSRSLADCCAPSLSPAFALAPVTMCTRATEARRPRPCHDFAFVYALSPLSPSCLPLTVLSVLSLTLSVSRFAPLVRTGEGTREVVPLSPLSPAVGCWQICVAAGICFRFQ